MGKPLLQLLPALLAALLLSACGGGDSNDSARASASSANVQQSQVAADGFARFNYWRSQLGLQTLGRNSELDVAAQNHSSYQALNDQITHNEVEGKPGFTGVCLIYNARDPNCDPAQVTRLQAAHYSLQSSTTYAAGEVISQTPYTDGAAAADELIAAIYHRFVIFEPMFQEGGAGAATSASGRTYFTTDFAAKSIDPNDAADPNPGLGCGNTVVYPMQGQKGIPVSFSSASENPRPVPAPRDIVGYPVSIHGDIIYSITVASFSIQPHGGAPLEVQDLWPGVDPETEKSVAAIVPLEPLQPETTYDVHFIGKPGCTVNGVQPTIDRSWSFTTQ